MVSYPGFASLGMEIVGVFDNAPQKAGLTRGRYVIQPMASLRLWCAIATSVLPF